ncbi:MAG: SusD/RagB family nutrient-binding outer membrane lipoprotein, partial [Bacteroidota bacterium]
DLFFGGDIAANASKWTSLAKTLKFRMYVQTRKVDGSAAASAQAIVTEGDFLTDNFAFQYGTNLANPDSRHPNYSNDYDNGGNTYQSNYFMQLMIDGEGGLSDPRLRYYFYRQTLENTDDVNEQSCITFNAPDHFSASDPFCQLADGYWGRDHGDDAGIPPDDFLRTIYGVYPFGGIFDSDQGEGGSQGAGAGGLGVNPFMMSFYVNFLRAEAALTMGTADDAATQLEAGIRGSISTVISYGPNDPGYAAVQATLEPTMDNIDNYVNAVMTEFNSAGGAEAQLEIVIREYFKAAFGNGIEVYNAYRRTGYPNDVQPSLVEASGEFIRTFFYPAVFVTRNQNASQKADVSTLVFWDDGSINLR